MKKVINIEDLVGGEKEEDAKKPVEFVKFLGHEGTLCDARHSPPDFAKVFFIGNNGERDVFICKAKRTDDFPYIYLGHLNDGVY